MLYFVLQNCQFCTLFLRIEQGFVAVGSGSSCIVFSETNLCNSRWAWANFYSFNWNTHSIIISQKIRLTIPGIHINGLKRLLLLTVNIFAVIAIPHRYIVTLYQRSSKTGGLTYLGQAITSDKLSGGRGGAVGSTFSRPRTRKPLPLRLPFLL